MASDSWNKAIQKPLHRRPKLFRLRIRRIVGLRLRRKRAKSRRLKPLFLGTGLVSFAVFGVSAIYGSPPNWTFPPQKARRSPVFLQAADSSRRIWLRSWAEARARGSGPRFATSAPRSHSSRSGSTRSNMGTERVWISSASASTKIPPPDLPILQRGSISWRKKPPCRRRLSQELTDVLARLDKLEKRIAAAAAPASEIAGLTTRLNRLEKRVAVAGASSAKPLPPGAPRQPRLMARAEPSAPNETARPDDPGPVLRDYNVESVRDGVAVVNGRDGPQEVAPGDSVPGAGRVLRIEKQGNDWFVLTSRGVIESGPAPLAARLARKGNPGREVT